MVALRVFLWVFCLAIPFLFMQFFWDDLNARQKELTDRRDELKARLSQSQRAISTNPQRKSLTAENLETLRFWLEQAGWKEGQPYDSFVSDFTASVQKVLGTPVKGPSRTEDFAVMELTWEGPADRVREQSLGLLLLPLPTRYERYSFTLLPKGRARAEGALAALWLRPLDVEGGAPGSQ